MYFTRSATFGLPENLIEDLVLDKCETIYTSAIKHKFHLPKPFSNSRLQLLPSYSGIGIMALKDVVGLEHLLLFIRYIRSNARIGKICRAQVEWYEFHAGLPIIILQLRRSQPLYCDKLWLKSALQFMKRHSIRIDIKPKHVIYRENYAFIMEKSELFSSNTTVLKGINSIRLKLGAMTLSDLYGGNRTTVDLNLFNRKTSHKLSTPNILSHITQTDIMNWNNFIRNMQATISLGKWYSIPLHRRRIIVNGKRDLHI